MSESPCAVTFADRPDLREAELRLHAGALPPFMSHGTAIRRYWHALYDQFTA